MMDETMNTLERIVDLNNRTQNYIVSRFVEPHVYTYCRMAFAFVFFYFGLQKPAPTHTPVYEPVVLFTAEFGISGQSALLFIGTYEMSLGLLILFNRIRVAFWMFLAHQAVTILSLVIIPYVAFQPPWLTVFGLDIPWALGGYSAFVLKNLVFVAAFLLLAAYHFRDER
jgi:uncharacterized membrane protein YkgB